MRKNGIIRPFSPLPRVLFPPISFPFHVLFNKFSLDGPFIYFTFPGPVVFGVSPPTSLLSPPASLELIFFTPPLLSLSTTLLPCVLFRGPLELPFSTQAKFPTPHPLHPPVPSMQLLLPRRSTTVFFVTPLLDFFLFPPLRVFDSATVCTGTLCHKTGGPK